ncbi:glutamate decarboxylase, partial [Rickenella mellea]
MEVDGSTIYSLAARHIYTVSPSPFSRLFHLSKLVTMPLSRHIDANSVIESCKDHPHKQHLNTHSQRARATYHQSWSRDSGADVPKYTMPKNGIPSKSAYQLLHDELTLDGNPTLNLASFVQTWMPEEAEKLIIENMNKNAVDLDEYPACQVIHNRCVSMIADLWKAPTATQAVGTATAGSSEAIMLGGLALKKRWQSALTSANPPRDPYHPGPNIIFGANAQVALEKFARYWDVETRLVPVKAKNDFIMDPRDAIKLVDENTIGIIVIMGSTYTGHFEDVQLMSDLLDDLQKRTGIDVPIHVDAASGGFFAPFAYPNYKWAFDVPRVHSINTSGHKFGLVYPGLGWIVWKDETFLHKDLIFELHYLGSVEYSYTLNFSKPAAPFIAQMFNFLNLGFDGYRKIALKGLKNARLLSRALEGTYFTVLSNVHKPASPPAAGAAGLVKKAADVLYDEEDPERYQRGLPVVSFRLSDEFMKENPNIKQEWISIMLRAKGWIVPNYGAPPNEEKTEMLRVVVRETLSEDLVERLIADILEVTEGLMGMSPSQSPFGNNASGSFVVSSSSVWDDDVEGDEEEFYTVSPSSPPMVLCASEPPSFKSPVVPYLPTPSPSPPLSTPTPFYARNPTTLHNPLTTIITFLTSLPSSITSTLVSSYHAIHTATADPRTIIPIFQSGLASIAQFASSFIFYLTLPFTSSNLNPTSTSTSRSIHDSSYPMTSILNKRFFASPQTAGDAKDIMTASLAASSAA